MGTLKRFCCYCCGWSAELVIILVIVAALPSSHCEWKEEIDFIQIPSHPNIDENSPFDKDHPFVPHKVKKPTPPSVVPNCKCGEHDYNGSRIHEMDCGQDPPPIQEKSGIDQYVVNGTETDKSQFPWVVALVERRSNGSAIHFCGGTLISNKLVLTALHCFTTRAINATEVWLNEKNLSLLGPDTVKIQAKRLIVHPSYNPIMNYNDIALVELSQSVNIKENHLRPICLPSDEAVDSQRRAYTAGWGQIKYNGPRSVQLRHTCLPLLSHQDCTTKTVPYFKARVTKHMICAGDIENGGRDACPGDSGGPLFVEDDMNGKRRYILVGVVSWGDQCALPRRPGVYTRVSKYMSWIHEKAQAHPDNEFCG